jgi:hypothetical protein
MREYGGSRYERARLIADPIAAVKDMNGSGDRLSTVVVQPSRARTLP